MPEEESKTKVSHEVGIALIQKDIEYMRKSVTKIEADIGLMDKNFARRDELVNLEKIVGDLAKEWEKKQEANTVELNKKIESKVSSTEFDPIKKLLTKINWLLITAVIVGLLSLIVKVPAV